MIKLPFTSKYVTPIYKCFPVDSLVLLIDLHSFRLKIKLLAGISTQAVYSHNNNDDNS